ncbi:DUF6356 family protein [Phenylobacterium sp. LH3H17]|uniref:DUF6356 family protein n=1 Tax=Phenylobacterium sp. LH3H17 TaxID=2903901 RepID=UPI0020C9E91F|nr:DUF6356 family protein [Phenylobacterium sp. LH3H17]UTP38278.1 DUF6356 family protein [Phenylobacterium sp. LH3H17]
MFDQFTRHPHSVGETYAQHFRMACGFASAMILAGCACLVHAVLPFLFERTASDCVDRLHGVMKRRLAGGPATSTRR